MKRLINRFKRVFKTPNQKEVAKTEAIKENIKLLTLSENSLNYYRKNVKGNENIPEEQARRKMTRNMMLAFQYKKDSEKKKYPRVWHTYGCLRFIVKNNEVISILNHQPVYKVWEKDWDRYVGLNKEFEIDEKYIK